MRTKALLSAIAVNAVLVMCACGDDGGEKRKVEPGAFVGKVDGSDAYIAVVTDGTHSFGYVCDGKKLSTWIDAVDVSGGKAELASRRGQSIGETTFTPKAASGEIVVAGQSRRFTAKLATGNAGLFRSAALKDLDGKLGPGEFETGWIVLQDGTQRGNTNVFDPPAGIEVRPAPRLDPGAPTVTTNVGGRAVELPVQPIKGFLDPLATL